MYWKSYWKLQGIVIITLLTINPWGVALNAELRPFQAEYVAQFRGLPVKARGTRTLEKIADNIYRLSSSADSLMVKVLEYSEFELTDGHLIPLLYHYERKGIGRNKRESSEFDWDSGLVRHDEGDTALLPNTLDKLSYQYQLRLDVAEAMANGATGDLLTYIVSDEEKRKEYVFRITGEESLKTPIGDLNTVRVERIHDADDKKSRKTAMWLSTDHDYVLVRLRIEEGDRGFELNLDAFQDPRAAAD